MRKLIKMLKGMKQTVAEEYYIQNYSPTGELFGPVLALHTTYDELLPVSNYEYYEQVTKIKHSSHYYVNNILWPKAIVNFLLMILITLLINF